MSSGLDPEQIRKVFPHLAHSVYLNTASAGLSWLGQGAAAAEFFDGGKMTGIGGIDQWRVRVDETRAALGRLVGVPAERIHFAGSTTEALNLVARSMPLAADERVVFAEDEFPSVADPWIALQSSGVKLERVSILHESERTAALCAAINSNTRVLTVSHVHWRTGTRVDLEALGSACRKHDCRLLVDGVQAVGAIPVHANVADVYCASVFKWLLSGFGLAFMVLSERIANEFNPVFRGYSNPPPSRSLRYGHLNYPGIYALHASLRLLESFGWENIYQRVAALAAHTLSALRDHGFDVATPQDSHAGIVSIRHADSGRLVAALAAQSIFVEDGSPYLRVSPHFYNTHDEIGRFVSALVSSARS